MSSITQVITLFIICTIPFDESVGDETVSAVELLKMPGLVILKDVRIWKYSQSKSLVDIYGSDLQTWKIQKSELTRITEFCSIALGCLYSKKLIDVVQMVERHIATCDGERELIQVNFEILTEDSMYIQCILNARWMLKDPIISEMLITVFNYMSVVNVPADKQLLKGLMSLYLFANTIENDKPFYNVLLNRLSLSAHLTYELTKMSLYTRNAIEAFTVRNCASWIFDQGLSETSDEYILPYLANLNLPETHFKLEDINLKNIMLSDVLDIELIYGNESTRVKYLTVSYKDQDLQIQQVYEQLIKDYYSENITKFQILMFETIASIVLYLIDTIIRTKAQLKVVDAIKDLDLTCVATAIDTLQNFDFPGLPHITLRIMKYEKMFKPSIDEPFTSINTHFINSNFDYKSIQKMINNELQEINSTKFEYLSMQEIYNNELQKTNSIKLTIFMLENFTNKLNAMEYYIRNAVEINKNLCDYEYEDVGFVQYASEDVRPSLSSFNNDICAISYNTIHHFILSDFLVSQCESIAYSLTTDPNSTFTSKDLVKCFNTMEVSIKSLQRKCYGFFISTLKQIVSVNFIKLNNRKALESIVASVLYFNNTKWFQELLNSAALETGKAQLDFNLIVSKLEVFRRSHIFITNLIEQYTIHNCIVQSPQKGFVQLNVDKINDKCIVSKKNELTLAECISKLINQNVEETETSEKSFDIDKLLLTDILETSQIEGNKGISMLQNLKVSWEGQLKTLIDIQDFVKNDTHPKYLFKYLLIMTKAFFFIAYEKMKIVVTQTADNHRLTDDEITQIITALHISNKYFPFGITSAYKIIVVFFKTFLTNIATFDKSSFIKIIESEQSNLGMEYITVSSSEVSYVENAEMNRPNKKQKLGGINETINIIFSFLNDYYKIWESLRDAAYVLYSRKVDDIPT